MRRTRIRAGWALAGAALAVMLGQATGVATPIGDGQGGVKLRSIGNFDGPIYIARAPGVSHRFYVVERGGKVLAVSTQGRRRFLNITGRVSTDGERGLLSIAFDPGFRQNRLFYAYYTNNAGDLEIDGFHAPSNVDARESSRRTVITIPHPGTSYHNGGTIAFGRDGYLYLATGDGGTGGANAQDKESLLGKVLRIGPHQRAGRSYTVPPGNPFVGRPGRNEIYALGLRNPFRWSFDGRRIAIGDVGEGEWEEVDYERAHALRGANFGWPFFEGNHRHQSGAKPAHYEPPIYNYPHKPGKSVITGGLVVRDAKLPSLYGRYLFSDYAEGELRTLIPHLGGASDQKLLGLSVSGPVAFCAGPHHRVYVAALNAGVVYKLVPG